MAESLFKLVENTVGKGEIARYEQCLLFPSVFKRLVSQGRQKVSLCGNGLTIYQTTSFWPRPNSKHLQTTIHMLLKWRFVFDRAENIVGKGENAGYQHFLLFPQCFQRLLSKGH